MSGIPYWGAKTYEDTAYVLTVEPVRMSLKELNNLAYTLGSPIEIKDIRSLFVVLSDLEFLFVTPDENTLFFTWCHDIKFNYRDRLLFIPYYIYDEEPYSGNLRASGIDKIKFSNGDYHIKHSFEYRTRVIDDRDTGYKDYNLTLFSPKSGHYISISFEENLPYLDEVPSLEELHRLYLDSAYFTDDYSAYMEYATRYIRTTNKYKDNYEHVLRNRLGLPTFITNFVELRYQDVRSYPYEELHGDKEVVSDKSKFLPRLVRFESYLYCMCASGVTPTEVDEKEYEELGKTTRFISYGDSKPVIIKYYYKNNPNMRRKSYERYQQR